MLHRTLSYNHGRPPFAVTGITAAREFDRPGTQPEYVLFLISIELDRERVRGEIVQTNVRAVVVGVSLDLQGDLGVQCLGWVVVTRFEEALLLSPTDFRPKVVGTAL